jgi:small-conductance mechanosensitive channel/CRP-like cAMP-binding protein
MRGYRALILPALLSAIAFLAANRGAELTGLGDQGRSLLRHAAGVLEWLALAWLGSRLFDLLVSRAMGAGVEAARYPRLLGDLVRALLFGLAIVAILVYVFDGAAMGLVATSSVVIAVIGFALRNILADVFSGIALNFERPYRLGDWLETGAGTIGRVTEIDWRATQLRTRDGLTVIIPNGVIAGGRLVNYSRPGPDFRASLRVALDASVPVERAKRLLLAGALDADRAFPGLRPDVLLQEFGEAGAVYVVRFWISDYAQENACRDAVATGVLAGLRRVGLAPAHARHELVLARGGRTFDRHLPREELLESIDLFAPFGSAEKAALVRQMEERHLARGTTLVREGEDGDSLFILAEGALDVSVSGPDGADRQVDRRLAGDLFGEFSLLTGGRRSATVTAATDVVVYEIRKTHLAPILLARPVLADGLAAVMEARQRRSAEILSRPAPAAAPRAKDDLASRLKAFFGLVSSP